MSAHTQGKVLQSVRIIITFDILHVSGFKSNISIILIIHVFRVRPLRPSNVMEWFSGWKALPLIPFSIQWTIRMPSNVRSRLYSFRLHFSIITSLYLVLLHLTLTRPRSNRCQYMSSYFARSFLCVTFFRCSLSMCDCSAWPCCGYWDVRPPPISASVRLFVFGCCGVHCG